MNAASLLLLLLRRLAAAFTTLPDREHWILAGSLSVLFALTAVPAGFLTGFFRIEIVRSWRILVGTLLASLLSPAIAEETLFRVVMLPHPSERASLQTRLLAAAISLFLFVASHPLKAWKKHSPRSFTFKDPTFLITAALLGLACTVAYAISGSVWPPVVIHWVAVFVWLSFLGGRRLMAASRCSPCLTGTEQARFQRDA